MSKSRRVPMSRDGIRTWCMRAFERGMSAQSERVSTPPLVFKGWWEEMAGPDLKPPRSARKVKP